MVKTSLITLLIIIISATDQFIYAQNAYAVFYKYKPQEHFSLDNPAEFLGEKALLRRAKEGVVPDSTDLPVSDSYVATLKPMVQKIKYHSKWLNASVVRAEESDLAAILDLPFVDKIDYLAPGPHENGRLGNKSGIKATIEKKNANKKTEDFEFQNSLIGIPQMFAEGLTGAGVTVAVFDGGFFNVNILPAFQHLFDNNQIIATKDLVFEESETVFHSSGHGTNVLSLIAAYQEEAIIGGAYNANYVLCLTEDVRSEYRIEEYNWVRAAEFADSLGTDIINSSLGYYDFDDSSMDYSIIDFDGKTAIISQGAALAAKKGILVVTSVGNYGTRGSSSLTAPSDAEGILSVGSVGSSLERSSFSSMGPTIDGRTKPELVAFGQGVSLLRPNGTVGTTNGTSFSAPQVTALAAGIWEGRPEWTKDQLLDALLNSASQAENPDSAVGYGIPDFYKAYFGEILNLEPESEPVIFSLYPNPLEGQTLYFKYGNTKGCEFTLFDVQGKVIAYEQLKRTDHTSPYEIELGGLKTGLYIVELKGEQVPKRVKLLKK
ncbi:S8 family peptidase [Pararhodonellum marinum]|uniref:S8 family peptidase n=1 Tax=Pararhodonellum marinum TaxID=2755358 RepID=UPI00188F8D01|nr:S8 family peptidase [Pararhodonellum marinum]